MRIQGRQPSRYPPKVKRVEATVPGGAGQGGTAAFVSPPASAVFMQAGNERDFSTVIHDDQRNFGHKETGIRRIEQARGKKKTLVDDPTHTHTHRIDSSNT